MIKGLNPFYEDEYKRVKAKAGVKLPSDFLPYSDAAYQFFCGHIAKQEGKPINSLLGGGQITSFMVGYNLAKFTPQPQKKVLPLAPPAPPSQGA